MANLTYLSLDDPVDASLYIINSNFAALDTEISGKANSAHTHSASDITSGVLDPARMGGGTPGAGTFLRGDGQWAAVGWNDINGKPSTYTPASHSHSASDITSGVLDVSRLGTGSASNTTFLRGDGQWASVAWSNISGRPSLFPPDAHTHSGADIASGVIAPARLGSGTPSSTAFLRGDGQWTSVAWGDISGRPSVFPPDTHTHAAADINSGVIAAARLGSGTASSSVFLRGDSQWAAVGWADVTGKPSTFTPSAHTHPPSEIQQAGASTGQALVWNGSQWAPGTVAGGDSATPYTAVSSNITATSNTRYRVTANNVTITLPASPANGDWVALIGENVSGCVVARNGRNIMGLAENMDIDMPYFALCLVFVSATNDWRVAP